MLQQISSNVYRWTELHGAARNEPYDWNSYIVHLPEANKLALVDPLPLSNDEIRQLESIAKPTDILLTNSWHLREAERYRQKWGGNIYLNRTGVDEEEVPIDETLQEGDRLWDAIHVVDLSGVYLENETAFWVNGVWIIGDALCGGRIDQGIADGDGWDSVSTLLRRYRCHPCFALETAPLRLRHPLFCTRHTDIERREVETPEIPQRR